MARKATTKRAVKKKTTKVTRGTKKAKRASKTTRKATKKVAKKTKAGKTVTTKPVSRGVKYATVADIQRIERTLGLILTTVQEIHVAISGPTNTPDVAPKQMDLFDTPSGKANGGQATFTRTDIEQALQKVSTTVGLPKVGEILTSVGAKNISGVATKDYAKVMELCADEDLVAQGEAAIEAQDTDDFSFL